MSIPIHELLLAYFHDFETPEKKWDTAFHHPKIAPPNNLLYAFSVCIVHVATILVFPLRTAASVARAV
jgi:hypothetical protein